MDMLFLIKLLMCSSLVYGNGARRVNCSLSKEDDIKFVRRLKPMNKPAITSIKTEYGDLYDCVDFFQQPAFDHPLLKNNLSNFEVIPPSVLNIIKNQGLEKDSKVKNIGLRILDCPAGTVPIRRVAKEFLIKEQLASKQNALENNGIYFAAVNTTGIYSGSGAFISTHNPKVSGTQYSSARLKIMNKLDGIQAGWRVDPKLYHDSYTRLFIRTDAGQTRCFNTLCPGFVVVRRDIPVDAIIEDISVHGGPRYTLKMFIIRDEHGNWNLQFGPSNIVIGYWPARLFTGLSGLASFLEWGGEVYSPPDIPSPPMGEGEADLTGDTKYSAYFKQVSAYNEEGQRTDANYLQRAGEGFVYLANDLGVVDKDNFKHLVLYGGAGGIKEK